MCFSGPISKNRLSLIIVVQLYYLNSFFFFFFKQSPRQLLAPKGPCNSIFGHIVLGYYYFIQHVLTRDIRQIIGIQPLQHFLHIPIPRQTVTSQLHFICLGTRDHFIKNEFIKKAQGITEDNFQGESEYNTWPSRKRGKKAHSNACLSYQCIFRTICPQSLPLSEDKYILGTTSRISPVEKL